MSSDLSEVRGKGVDPESLDSLSVQPYREEPSHSSAYEELLDAKEKQNNALSIPVTAGPGVIVQSSPPVESIDGTYAEPPVAGVAQTSGGPEIARSVSPRSSMGQSQEFLGQSTQTVHAVPITSVYNQVASAELIQASEPKVSLTPAVATESEEEKVLRLRAKHQRFKFAKLVILLAILVVVVTVPLVIRKQRLSDSSTSTSPSGSKLCFASYDELESAVDDYLAGGGRLERSLQQYGSPIGSWCVSKLQGGMDDLFSAERNPRAAEFNDPLYYWDVSNIVSMREMFKGATAFSQPLNMWNVTSVRNMISMFRGATSFRQDLCAWRDMLSNGTVVFDMFLNTSCSDQEDPELGASASGPFCTPCSP